MRHTTLIETQKDLKDMAVYNQEEIENEQVRYTAERKVKIIIIMKFIYIYIY